MAADTTSTTAIKDPRSLLQAQVTCEEGTFTGEKPKGQRGNHAARLMERAQPNTVCLTPPLAVRRQSGHMLPLAFGGQTAQEPLSSCGLWGMRPQPPWSPPGHHARVSNNPGECRGRAPTPR